MSKKEYDELTADDIFNLDDLEIEELNIEEWNGKVYMRTFTGTERAQLQTKFASVNVKSGNSTLDVMLTVFVYGICDGNGKRLFKNDKPTLDKLKSKKGTVIESAANQIMIFNGLAQAEKKIEENAKNS
jgi:hypothetical protein